MGYACGSCGKEFARVSDAEQCRCLVRHLTPKWVCAKCKTVHCDLQLAIQCCRCAVVPVGAKGFFCAGQGACNTFYPTRSAAEACECLLAFSCAGCNTTYQTQQEAIACCKHVIPFDGASPNGVS